MTLNMRWQQDAAATGGRGVETHRRRSTSPSSLLVAERGRVWMERPASGCLRIHVRPGRSRARGDWGERWRGDWGEREAAGVGGAREKDG
jgi:hypothetical protein